MASIDPNTLFSIATDNGYVESYRAIRRHVLLLALRRELVRRHNTRRMKRRVAIIITERASEAAQYGVHYGATGTSLHKDLLKGASMQDVVNTAVASAQMDGDAAGDEEHRSDDPCPSASLAKKMKRVTMGRTVMSRTASPPEMALLIAFPDNSPYRSALMTLVVHPRRLLVLWRPPDCRSCWPPHIPILAPPSAAFGHHDPTPFTAPRSTSQVCMAPNARTDATSSVSEELSSWLGSEPSSWIGGMRALWRGRASGVSSTSLSTRGANRASMRPSGLFEVNSCPIACRSSPDCRTSMRHPKWAEVSTSMEAEPSFARAESTLCSARVRSPPDMQT